MFGRGRLQMITGHHVEVFRDATLPGERRRYTKRFLQTATADFRPWTERESRILELLGKQANAPVAKRVSSAPAEGGEPPRLQTYDAGATVDQWATRVPLRSGGAAIDNLFAHCGYWWLLARQCLIALDALHALGFVHLDLKADNLCIPWAPAGADRPAPGTHLTPRFEGLALIDVAFSRLPDLPFTRPLPLAQLLAYEYQSPRLLRALDEGRRGNLGPSHELDWRCDFFSLAAMLWRYLPEPDAASGGDWTAQRHAQASALVRLIVDAHGEALPQQRPHGELIALATQRLSEPRLAAALEAGCTFDPERALSAASELTPLTRVIARVERKEQKDTPQEPAATAAAEREPASPPRTERSPRSIPMAALVAAAIVSITAAAAWWGLGKPVPRDREPIRAQASDPAASVVAAPPPPDVPPTPPTASNTSPTEKESTVPAIDGDFDAIAAELIRNRIPRIARSAEQRIAPVLAIAGQTRKLRPASEVRAAARSARLSAGPPSLALKVSNGQARALNEAARVAYWRRDSVPDAVRLQTRAFGANPLDSEIVGNLAFLRLRERPPQAEASRQLALHALTLADKRFPSGRSEDWTTFAIASALTGHESDARNAWFVLMAVSNDMQRHCTAAIRAQAIYGDRLRSSVQAMLQRARSSPADERCGMERKRGR